MAFSKEQLPQDLAESFDSVAGQQTLSGAPQPSLIDRTATVSAPEPDAQGFTSSPISGGLVPNALQDAARSATGRWTGSKPFGTFGHKIGEAAEKLGIPKGPGGWAKSLVGAAQSVLAGATDIDTTAAKNTGAAGGALEGVFGTLQNRAQRMAKEKVAQQEQQQKQVENDREQQKLDMMAEQTASQIASNNVQKMHTEQIMRNTEKETQLKDIARQKKDFEEVTKSDAPLEDVKFPLLTDIQLQDKIATGEIVTGADKAYHIGENAWAVTMPGADRTVTEEQSKDIKEYAKQDIAAGTVMPSTPFNTVMQKVATNRAVTDIRDEMIAKNAKNKEAAQEEIDRLEAVDLRPEFVQAMAEAGSGGPVKALGILQHRADTDPEFAKENPNLQQSFIENFGGTELWNAELNRRTQLQIAREKEAAEKAATSKYKGDSAALSAGVETEGPYKGLNMAYLQTLPQDDQGVVLQAATGRMNIQNLAYLLGRQPEFANAVANVSPDFDATRAQKFADLYKNFTSGPIATARNAAGTAIKHLKKLYEVSAPGNAVNWLNPLTQSYKERQTVINTLAPELAKFYKGGNAAPTEKETEEFRKVIGGKNPYNARTALTTQAHLMREKLNEYDAQWDEAVPAPQYTGQKPQMSREAQEDFEYLENDGRVAPKLPGQPQSAVGQVEWNGKKYWVDGNRKNLGEVKSQAPVDNMGMSGGM